MGTKLKYDDATIARRGCLTMIRRFGKAAFAILMAALIGLSSISGYTELFMMASAEESTVREENADSDDRMEDQESADALNLTPDVPPEPVGTKTSAVTESATPESTEMQCRGETGILPFLHVLWVEKVA